jgi:hypothetical protein
MMIASRRRLRHSAACFGGHMQRQFFTTAFLITALALYGAGLITGASALFAMGAACELWFWSCLRRHRASA